MGKTKENFIDMVNDGLQPLLFAEFQERINYYYETVQEGETDALKCMIFCRVLSSVF